MTFGPADTSETVTILVNGDTIDEADETFFVNLSNPINVSIADGQGRGTITDDDTQPPPPPPASTPTAKSVILKAQPKKVEKGDKTKLTVVVSPCAGHEGDTVDIYRGSAKIATKATDGACTAVHKVKMKKTATFKAVSPVQDADHLEGTSNTVKVKVNPG